MKLKDLKFTPGPWKWEGEDYRGGWGWQVLVDENGMGILCGEDNGKPYEHLRAYVVIDSKYTKTGALADGDSCPGVHVLEHDATLIRRAPEMLEILKKAEEALQGLFLPMKGPSAFLDAQSKCKETLKEITDLLNS